MTVPFANIPAALRVPLFYAELDASQASTAVQPQRALLIGRMTTAGTAAAGAPVLCASISAGRMLAGAGSQLAAMVAAYRANDPDGELWLLPIADDPDAVAQVRTMTVQGTTTEAGTVSLYVNDMLVAIALGANMGPTATATAVANAVNQNLDLPVTASSVAAGVSFTAKNAGAGIPMNLSFNARGSEAGEVLPAGFKAMFGTKTVGAGIPSLTVPLASLGDMSFDFIVTGQSDAASLASTTAMMNDVDGRWAWSQQIYGHVFAGMNGTSGTLATAGAALNDQHLTVIGSNGSPTPPFGWAAAFAGRAAVSLRVDPGLPLQYLQVAGVMAPAIANRFPLSIRSALLYEGISTFTVARDGTVVIENVITTYQVDAQGRADNSYLEIETLFLLMFVLRRMSSVVTTKYARTKLAADGTRALPGSNVVTPSTIKADVIAAYRQMEAEGMVQQSDAFAAGLVVEKDAQNPNRVNVLWPGTLVNQLRVFALLAQFRLS